MADLCSIANKASKSAKKFGTPEAHATAAYAHERAAKVATAEGDLDKAKKHASKAADHHQLAQDAESASESNPLLAWTKVKA